MVNSIYCRTILKSCNDEEEKKGEWQRRKKEDEQRIEQKVIL